MTEIQVGDRTIPLPALNGYKAVRAARLVAEAARCAPEVNERLAALRKDYATENALIITPDLAKLPRFQRIEIDSDGKEKEIPMFSEEDFEAAGGEIRIPQEPPVSEQVIAIFPTVFEAAESQIIELLALLISPNSELAEADEDGTADEYLKKAGRNLLHTASLDQLVTLAVAAVEQVSEALVADGGAALERAMGAVRGNGSRTETSTPTPPSTQGSPIASEGPTDGQGENPSTGFPGEKSGSKSGG
jgi:hypothetical protein